MRDKARFQPRGARGCPSPTSSTTGPTSGRGEFVRLVLEEAAAPYRDVGRLPAEESGGALAVAAFWSGDREGHPIFSPPVLKQGELVLSQTAAICHFLGRRHELAPQDEAGQAQALQLTIADLGLFQALEGVAYAFPRGFALASEATPGVLALRERVRGRPRIAAYLASERRMPFNQEGIFRRYPELDAD